jgi:SAM-dependent methyltransferase
MATGEVLFEPVTSCDLCQGTRFEPVVSSPDLGERIVAGEFQVVRCAACSLSMLSPRPRPETIANVYPSDYKFYDQVGVKRLRWWQRIAGRCPSVRAAWPIRLLVRLRQQIAFHRVPPFHGQGVMLDVGCGNGDFLDTMKQLGWTTFGVDLSSHALAAAGRKGHDVQSADAETLPFEAARFDLVHLSHVLEHTYSPRRALAGILRVLKPGGLLVMAVPNFGGFQARAFGRFWSALDLPRHLYQFDSRTLRRYLEEAGFVIRELATRTGATSLAKSVRLFANQWLGTSWRRDPAGLVAPCEVLTFLSTLVGNLGAGRDLRVVCQKPLPG